MSESQDLQRSLGKVEGSLEALESRVGRIDRAMAEGFKDIGDKLDVMATAQELVKTELAGHKGKSRGVHSAMTLIGAAAMSVLSLAVAIWGAAFGQ